MRTLAVLIALLCSSCGTIVGYPYLDVGTGVASDNRFPGGGLLFNGAVRMDVTRWGWCEYRHVSRAGYSKPDEAVLDAASCGVHIPLHPDQLAGELPWHVD